MVDLKARPFNLNGEQIKWVEDTLSSMTLREKVGQVFCPMGYASDDSSLHHTVAELGVGGMMYRPGAAAEIQDTHRRIQEMAKKSATVAMVDLLMGR